jgi:hypothetical protein
MYFDTWNHLQASSQCSNFVEQIYTLNITDASAIKWITTTDQGKAWAKSMNFPDPITFAPSRACTSSDPQPTLNFVNLVDNQSINQSPLQIQAVINATANFKDYSLQFGYGDSPSIWMPIVAAGGSPSGQMQNIANWDISTLQQGRITLELVMNSTTGGYAKKDVHIDLMMPTPTPTQTPTPTATPTQTATPTITLTPTATETAAVIPSETPTP